MMANVRRFEISRFRSSSRSNPRCGYRGTRLGPDGQAGAGAPCSSGPPNVKRGRGRLPVRGIVAVGGRILPVEGEPRPVRLGGPGARVAEGDGLLEDEG